MRKLFTVHFSVNGNQIDSISGNKLSHQTYGVVNNLWDLFAKWAFPIVSHVVCFHFISKCRDLQFNGDSEQQIFEKLFNGSFIYSEKFLPEIY